MDEGGQYCTAWGKESGGLWQMILDCLSASKPPGAGLGKLRALEGHCKAHGGGGFPSRSSCSCDGFNGNSVALTVQPISSPPYRMAFCWPILAYKLQAAGHWWTFKSFSGLHLFKEGLTPSLRGGVCWSLFLSGYSPSTWEAIGVLLTLMIL